MLSSTAAPRRGLLATTARRPTSCPRSVGRLRPPQAAHLVVASASSPSKAAHALLERAAAAAVAAAAACSLLAWPALAFETYEQGLPSTLVETPPPGVTAEYPAQLSSEGDREEAGAPQARATGRRPPFAPAAADPPSFALPAPLL